MGFLGVRLCRPPRLAAGGSVRSLCCARESVPTPPPAPQAPPLRRGGVRGGAPRGAESVLCSGVRADPPCPPCIGGVSEGGRGGSRRGGGAESVLCSGRRTDPPCPPCVGGVSEGGRLAGGVRRGGGFGGGCRRGRGRRSRPSPSAAPSSSTGLARGRRRGGFGSCRSLGLPGCPLRRSGATCCIARAGWW